ncbi:hypothetical protein KM043_017995 [Ampulex compressa]|nr:hypothetical protein KM043_017995 [Ampulex compressa]
MLSDGTDGRLELRGEAFLDESRSAEENEEEPGRGRRRGAQGGRERGDQVEDSRQPGLTSGCSGSDWTGFAWIP